MDFGDTDTFVNYFYRTNTPWSGYFPRAMLAVCRMYQDEQKRNGSVSNDLTTVCDNWVNYLAQFSKDNSGKFPASFPAEGAPYNEDNDDFGGHMEANFLSGACKLALAGNPNPNLPYLIEALHTEILNNYHVLEPGHYMNGSYSSWTGGGQFFGFWAGDILKGLGLYIQYKNSCLNT